LSQNEQAHENLAQNQLIRRVAVIRQSGNKPIGDRACRVPSNFTENRSFPAGGLRRVIHEPPAAILPVELAKTAQSAIARIMSIDQIIASET
jgi:hypothetical protein